MLQDFCDKASNRLHRASDLEEDLLVNIVSIIRIPRPLGHSAALEMVASLTRLAFQQSVDRHGKRGLAHPCRSDDGHDSEALISARQPPEQLLGCASDACMTEGAASRFHQGHARVCLVPAAKVAAAGGTTRFRTRREKKMLVPEGVFGGIKEVLCLVYDVHVRTKPWFRRTKAEGRFPQKGVAWAPALALSLFLFALAEKFLETIGLLIQIGQPPRRMVVDNGFPEWCREESHSQGDHSGAQLLLHEGEEVVPQAVVGGDAPRPNSPQQHLDLGMEQLHGI